MILSEAMIIPVRTGCMGWSYADWVGPFYPKGTRPADYLRLYSQVFDTVEVDSSFYGMPGEDMIRQWKDRTQDDFLFTLKMPKEFTHECKLRVDGRKLAEFERRAMGLKSKLACVLLLLSPSARYEDMIEDLKHIAKILDERVRYAIEFRNISWFRHEVYDLLREKNISLTWSANMYVDTPPVMTSDSVYLRFIGDRRITSFDRVQRDRTGELKEWNDRLKTVIEQGRARRAFVFSNNHFAGFAPETIFTFRKLAGLEVKEWRRAMMGMRFNEGSRQTSLDGIEDPADHAGE